METFPNYFYQLAISTAFRVPHFPFVSAQFRRRRFIMAAKNGVA